MTKERLRNYQALKREKAQILTMLEELETAMYSPKPQRLTGMPSAPSPSGGATDALVAKHAELLERYQTKLAELAEELHAIEDAIAQLDSTERALLRWRYIEGLKWEEVCVCMSYSWQQTHRIHARALRHLQAMGGGHGEV